MQTPSALHDVRARLAGELLLPDDDGYDTERLAWNLGVDQRPTAVAVPADVADVQAVVRAAAAAGLGVLTQPNGHSAGLDLDDIVLIRPRAFDEISVDVPARTARVGAGVNWGPVLTRLDATGLIALAGSNPEVNVVAYSLGGGHSLFGRTYGLQSPAVTAVELVDASGEFVRVTETSDPELMWALRGAGSLFGVVTAIEFSLFDGDELYGGKLTFAPADAARLLATTFEVAQSEPTLGLSFGIIAFPDAPVVPEPIRGKTLASVDVLHIGGADSGAPLLDPLRAIGTPIADTTQVFGIASVAAIAAEPTEPMAYLDWSATSSGYDTGSAEGLLAAFGEASARGVTRLEVRPFGGSLLRGDRTRAVAARVDAPSYLGSSVIAPNAAALEGADAAFDPLRAAVATTPATGNVPTLLDHHSTLADSFDADAIARLSALKDARDPNGVIRSGRRLPA
ncbi:FAD-binding protein [Planctomonas sp. JC2975]|uniref:FAD-binding oxidoreductase n=1 Tax=Planctomonas sp. JC2975 TaxID=2729626 RepID=UPI001473D157|nr:FAD-binding protein [Planctomonas sp. JC2975]NNC10980.1 FAD-binding protein [Planctomonas sp. JC2975]